MAIRGNEAAPRIREMREKLRFSQKKVAELVGIAESTVKRTEKTGKGHNKERIAAALAEELRKPRASEEIREAVAIAVEATGEAPSVMVREFLGALEKLPLAQQRTALRAFALGVTAMGKNSSDVES